jgi:tetratricopeptide (TPR) repeat protein/4-amino-4-deoxy-L-arabinose transferase-like glycosyltransferase
VPDFPKKLRLPDWVWAPVVLALALLLRLTYVWQVSGTSLIIPEDLDPGFYYEWAKRIAAGQWLGSGPFVQSPLYAYLLGLFMKVFGTGVTPILVAQSIAGTGTVYLTYRAGCRYFDRTRGLLAALLLAIYGPFLFYEGQVMKTFLSPLLTILLALALDRARSRAAGGTASGTGGAVSDAKARARTSAGAFLAAGIVFGLLTLDRDNFIILAPVLALLTVHLGGGWKQGGVRAAGIFACGAVLAILPATLHNWAVSKEFVLLTTGGGEVFFIGNNADANGLYVPPPFVRPDPKYEHADFIDRASEIEGRRLTPMESSWFWFREGMTFVAGEPLSWLRLLWLKFCHFWNWYEIPDNLDYLVLQWFSPLLSALNVSLPPPTVPTVSVPAGSVWMPIRLHLFSTFGMLAPLGLLGAILTRKRFRELLPLHVLVLGYAGTVLLFFNFSRFRVPVVPILALFAAEGLIAAGRFLRRGWEVAVAFAGRSGDLTDKARALVPGKGAAATGAAFLVATGFVNLERPRGVVPAIEQALVIGNAYYGQNEPEKARQSFYAGLVLLGEGPAGPAGDEALRRQFGSQVTREALVKELQLEAVARGAQFKGIHVGIHHGLGLALLQQAQFYLEQGKRPQAMPLLDRAIEQFNEALKIVSSYLPSHRKLALAYGLKGDSEQAREWLTKAVDLWPEDLQARLELAEFLYAGGEFNQALKELETAVRYNRSMRPEQMAQVYFNRALIFYRGLNEGGMALYDFEKALELNPGHPQSAAIQNAARELRARGRQPVEDEGITRALQSPPSGG